MNVRLAVGGLAVALGCSGTHLVKPARTVSKASDCEEAACSDRLQSFKQGLGVAARANPPSRTEIGRAGWTVLHSFAAYFPEEPSEQDKTMAKGFLEGFAHLFPCKHCAEHMRNVMEEEPPKYDSNRELSLWMCEFHNKVNEVTGKPTRNCDFGELQKQWRTG